jgi:hypothetical protein
MSDTPKKVFLRPDEYHRPIAYERSLEKGGLMVLPQQNLALWTISMGPQGPAGTPGTPYLNDTIIASASDEYSPLQVDLVDEYSPLQVDLVAPATTYRAPYPLELEYVRASLTTEPTGAPLIVDIHINGASIFSGTNYLYISAGSRTSVGSTPYTLATTSIPDDAEIQIFIRQVGSTVAGTGLKISLTGEKQDVA